MKRIEVPQDLAGVKEEDLQALSVAIEEAAAEIGADASRSDDTLTEIERLAAEYERVSEELALREEAAAERAARVDAARGRIGGMVSDDGPTEEMVDEEVLPEPIAAAVETPTTMAVEGETPVVLVAESTEELSNDDEEEAEEAEAEEVADEGAADEAEPEETEAAPEAADEVTASTETAEELAVDNETSPNVPMVPAEVLSGLSDRRPAAAAPVESSIGERRSVALRSTGTAQGIAEGEVLDAKKLALAISAKHHQLSKLGAGAIVEPIVVATAVTEFPREQMLTSGAEENFTVLANLTKQAESLVASGGNCAPLSPSYEFFRMAEPQSPVEDCLPVVGAPRGGIRFIQSPDFRDASGGVRVTTEAEDAAGYTNQTPPGTTAPKPCVSVTCPDVVDCQVSAVSQCVTFGNLNYRTFPEQIQSFLEDLAVIFAETKEVYYLDAIAANSTVVNITPPYGATRGTVFSILLAAHAYRKRNHMALDAMLDIVVPDTIIPFLKADMVNDHALGLGFLNATADDVAQIFRSWNLNPCFYYDSTTAQGAAANLEQPQLAGGLNPWPTTYVMYLFAPGTFVRLDGGTLDVGLVRDSFLNSVNDLQLFSEQWVQVCKVGIESIALNVTLCSDGGGPEPHPLLVCAS